MKLLYCEDCQDLFKLGMEEKICECGKVKGAYDSNGRTAWTNGKGISVAVDNNTFSRSVSHIRHTLRFSYTVTEDKYNYPKKWQFTAWVRPNNGFFNDRTRIVEE